MQTHEPTTVESGFILRSVWTILLLLLLCQLRAVPGKKVLGVERNLKTL